MNRIAVITGSARPNSVNKHVVSEVARRLKAVGDDVHVVDLVELDLPFCNGKTSPSSDDYQITDERVQRFSDAITQADGVVFVTPEYNHAMSAIMKNALDTLYKEWQNKPAAFVGYGWYSAKYSHENFLAVNSTLKLRLGETFTGLTFMKEISPDGSVKDESAYDAALRATLDELRNTIGVK